MEKQVKILNKMSLAKAVDSIVKESIKSKLYQNALAEKEKQSAVLDEEDDDLFNGGEAPAKEKSSDDSGDAAPEPAPSKTVDDEKDKLKTGDVKTADIVDKLNSIRAGKSFKDDNISASLEEYVQSLSKAEKVALLAFLKGLAQIVTGEIPAETASDPSSNPADVKMQKGKKKQSKTITPNVIKGGPSKDKSKEPEEDTEAPSPIVPKKK